MCFFFLLILAIKCCLSPLSQKSLRNVPDQLNTNTVLSGKSRSVDTRLTEIQLLTPCCSLLCNEINCASLRKIVFFFEMHLARKSALTFPFKSILANVSCNTNELQAHRICHKIRIKQKCNDKTMTNKVIT